MINLSKQEEFFSPTTLTDAIHIIGVGAVGSTIAYQLTRMGFTTINIYDFDTVDEHNLTNQIFRFKDIAKQKVNATEEICKEINPSIAFNKFPTGYATQQLSGYVFLAVDSATLRKKIAEQHLYNPNIKAILDFRMGLADGQTFYVDWTNNTEKNNYIKGCSFSDKETEANAPKNACGLSLNIISTVQTTVSLGIMNFIKAIKKENPAKLITINLLTNNILKI